MKILDWSANNHEGIYSKKSEINPLSQPHIETAPTIWKNTNNHVLWTMKTKVGIHRTGDISYHPEGESLNIC